jgi:hypothetical protein
LLYKIRIKWLNKNKLVQLRPALSGTLDQKGGAAMAMKRKISIGTGFILLLLVLVAGQVLADEAQPQTVFVTPTPGASGEIRYTVQEGENCLGISLKLQVDINELRRLNGLDEACSLQPNQELIVGFAATATAMPAITQTAEVSGPTPTVAVGAGTICVFLFDDINGDGTAISVTDKANKISENKTTVWDAPSICFEELPEGEYNISVAPPQGYNPTSNMNYALVLKAGQTSLINFGAQKSSEAPVDVPGGKEGGNTGNIVLGVVGILLVLVGIGLGIYFWLLKR